MDIRVHAVERGFGHGLVHMFAEDGTLMATASQSCIVRFWRDMPGHGRIGMVLGSWYHPALAGRLVAGFDFIDNDLDLDFHVGTRASAANFDCTRQTTRGRSARSRIRRTSSEPR